VAGAELAGRGAAVVAGACEGAVGARGAVTVTVVAGLGFPLLELKTRGRTATSTAAKMTIATTTAMIVPVLRPSTVGSA